MRSSTSARTLLLLGSVAVAGLAIAGQPRLAVAPGNPAPTLNVNMLDGNLDRADFTRSKATVVNFWATWCEPCKVEMPILQELYARRAADGLNVIGVHLVGKPIAEIESFIAQWGIEYPIRLGDPNDAESWSVGLLPTTFLIDGSGTIVRRYVGATPEQVAGLVADVESWLDNQRLTTMIDPEENTDVSIP